MKYFKMILASFIMLTLLQINFGVVNAANINTKLSTSNNSVFPTTTSDIKTIDIRVKANQNSDISKSVQQALDLARDFATDSMPYRIIIPKGTYKLKAPLNIYSNTQIYAVDAHIIKEHLSGGMLRTAMPSAGKELKGYSGYKNIKIEGGIWDGNSNSKIYGEGKCNVFSNFRFAHGKNIILKNLSITNNVGSHHLEIGGIDGISITGCTFKGYRSGGVSGGKEAIQLDVMYSPDVFVGYPSFDDTPCKNITITNNKFINVNRGIGNHTAVMGVYFDNIKITNNTFENINQQSILCFNWRNSIITKNTMKNVGSGIDFKSMDSGLYYNPKNGKANINSDVKTTISNNIISVRKNAYKDLPYVFGIRAWGDIVTNKNNSHNIAIGKYPIMNIKILNNKVTSYGKINGGISGRLMNNSKIYGNVVNFADTSNNKDSRGIYLKQSSNNIIEQNSCQKIKGSGSNGIHLVEGSNKNIIKSNTISDCSGSGISINSSSAYNVVTGGTVKKNGVNGISFNSASDNVVKEITNVTDNANYGISLNSSTKNKVNNVNVASSGKSGIILFGSSSDNVLSSAISKKNGDSGITIYNSKKNKITSSSFSSNKSYGISITGNSQNNNATLCNSNDNVKGQITISGSSKGNTIDSVKTQTTVKGILPSVPKNLRLVARSSISIKLKWEKSTNASGYMIYRNNGNGSFTKIKTIDNSSILTFTDNNLSSNKVYSYRVMSYYKANNNIIISSYDKNLTITTLLKAPSNVRATATRFTTQLTWNKVSGANGYYIYKYNEKSKSYQTIANIGGGNVLKIKNSGLSPNTKYKYKVAAYVKKTNNYICGDFSNIVAITTKK